MFKTSSAPATSTFSGWSVIVQSDLACSSVGQHLRQRDIKVKRAESVLEGSVIFPKAKVAFLVLEVTKQLLSQFSSSRKDSKVSDGKTYSHHKGAVDLSGISEQETERCTKDSIVQEDAVNKYATILDRLDKFTRIHRHCYIILQAPLFTERELAFLYHLQTRYLNVMSVEVLTGHSAEECVSAMLTISSLQTPPTSDKLHQRFCQLMNELVAPLPLETLTQISECENC